MDEVQNLPLIQIDPFTTGLGSKIRLNEEGHEDHLEGYNFDGFMLQLAENGRILKIDKTDAPYRALVWNELGLKGKTPNWVAIFEVMRFLPRRTSSRILYQAAVRWTNIQNENIKMFLEALSNQNITLEEFQGIMGNYNFDLFFSQVLDAKKKADEWSFFLTEETNEEAEVMEDIQERINSRIQD